jgi:hypothetical protein
MISASIWMENGFDDAVGAPVEPIAAAWSVVQGAVVRDDPPGLRPESRAAVDPLLIADHCCTIAVSYRLVEARPASFAG